MRKRLLIILVIFLSYTVHAQNSVIEDKIIDTIFKLKEVKQRASYMKKVTNDKRHLSIVINGEPTKEQPYYWIKVWEDNGSSYVTHFNFIVYPNPFEIKYFDAVNDTEISLKEWRRQMKNEKSN